MLPEFHSKNVRKDTMHTVSWVEQCIREGDAVIDIGCGEGYVLWQLAERHRLSETVGVDIVDLRRAPVPNFMFFDGVRVPVEDKRFDLVMLNFVLHHVPNDRKLLLLRESRRISRRWVFILEDTPKNFIDRMVSNRHGEKFRRKIGSDASFGFYSKKKWEEIFTDLGFSLAMSRYLGRFSRHWRRPYARCVFVLGVGGKDRPTG